ncbi:MAG: hypothetical protein QNI84_08970 [Henriciella sp.]|nr:hypothetical protein [Henriciella sp.]
MWYLWLQILFLLLLAALCGAGLAYWWLRGRYEDVTEIYKDLTERGTIPSDTLTASELDARLAIFDTRLNQLDGLSFAPLQQQIAELADATDTDERLSAIESALVGVSSSQDRIEQFGERVQTLETDLPQLIHSAAPQTEPIDLTPLQTQLNAIQDRLDRLETLGPELSTLKDQSAGLEKSIIAPISADLFQLGEKLAGLRNPDLAPVQQEIASVRDRIPALVDAIERLGSQLHALDKKVTTSEHNFAPINEKLADLSARAVSNTGNHNALAALDQKLGGFETAITAIKQRMDQIGGLLMTLDKRVDSTATHAKIDETTAAIAALRPSLSGLAALEPMEKGVAHLREMVFNLRERDLSSLNMAIRSIEGNVDFAGVENRLTSIEYGLAATHHMLRSRLERSSPDLPAPPQRGPFGTPPRDFAYAPPTAPQRPEAPVDPLDIIRVPGEPGNLLLEAGFGNADDLEKIRGIGPMLRQLLNDIGVFYYWQIASWNEAEVAMIDEKLPGYHGRIARDQWVEQAAVLMRLPTSAQRPQPFGRDL